jgi:glycosyltransferase involved in cell wall biosynthesis
MKILMAFKERIDLLIISGERFGYKSSSENINKQLELFKYLFHSVHLISFCNKNLIRGIDNNDFSFIISKKSNISQFFWSQINIGIEILRLSRNKEISRAIFISGSDLQTIPILICKLLTEDVIIRSDCRPTMALKKYIKNHSLIRMLLFKFLEEINYRSVDLVLTECDYLIKENDLIQYNCSSANWYIDTDKFRIIRPFDERRYTLAYVGRLDIDKGILTFLELLDLLDEDHRVLILGDGPCRNKVENKIKFEKNSNIEVTYVDWVERDELPCYLNEIKLLVYTYIARRPSQYSFRGNGMWDYYIIYSCGCDTLYFERWTKWISNQN